MKVNKQLLFSISKQRSLWGFTIGLSLISPGATRGQNVPPVVDSLPAPPPIPAYVSSPTSAEFTPQKERTPRQLIPVENGEYNNPPIVREFTFQAPSANFVTHSASSRNISSSAVQLYRVEAVGDSRQILDQIKQVEPFAFIRPGEGLIYSGLFQQSQEAQKRVEELETLGFTAQIVPVSYNRRDNTEIPLQPQAHR